MMYFNSQGYNHYYGPLCGQGLAPEYQPDHSQAASQWQQPGHDQAASQRQQLPVTTALDNDNGTRSASSQNESSFVGSVSLKIINPANKDTKNFVLRPCEIETPSQLRDEIVKQYGDKVSHTTDFEVGYFRGQQKVWIMTDDDLNDAGSMLCKGTGFLWCHGVRKSAKPPDSSDEDSDINEPNMEAHTVANLFVYHSICRYGVPDFLHTDQGRNFMSSLMIEICKLSKTKTSPYHPKFDGLVEKLIALC